MSPSTLTTRPSSGPTSAAPKQHHPDRYFRKNLGAYAAYVDLIFKRVLEAYELLSDPATRAEVHGIVSVSARDRQAGKEQSITVSATGTLSEDEVQLSIDDHELYEVELKAQS